MLHLVLCFAIWTVVFTYLFWRSLKITKQAVDHLKRLHQVPCSNCAYFTGDYRLKCTVNPIVAMSEEAIGCRDFLYEDGQTPQVSCQGKKQCNKPHQKKEHSYLSVN